MRGFRAVFFLPIPEKLSVFSLTGGMYVVAEWLAPPVPGARFRTFCAMQGLVRTAGCLPRQAA